MIQKVQLHPLIQCLGFTEKQLTKTVSFLDGFSKTTLFDFMQKNLNLHHTLNKYTARTTKTKLIALTIYSLSIFNEIKDMNTLGGNTDKLFWFMIYDNLRVTVISESINKTVSIRDYYMLVNLHRRVINLSSIESRYKEYVRDVKHGKTNALSVHATTSNILMVKSSTTFSILDVTSSQNFKDICFRLGFEFDNKIANYIIRKSGKIENVCHFLKKFKGVR